jgi:hypothetical protein
MVTSGINKPTGATTSTTSSGATSSRAALEQKLLKALVGAEGGAPLPPAQAKKALELAEALLARMDGAAAGAAGAAGADGIDEKTRSELIVKTWSNDWHASMPKMSAAEHQKLAAEYSAKIQERQKDIAPNGKVARTLHRKPVFATTEAKFTVNPNLPKELQFGPFTPGSEMRAIVRLSNASGKAQSDGENDQRGLAVRLTDGTHVQDMLATNWPVSHAKDTDDFIAASALLKGMLRGGPEFFTSMPPSDSVRMLSFLKKVLRPSESMAMESFYSRSQFQVGDKLVEFRWVPVSAMHTPSRGRGDDKLTDDMVSRHKEAPIKWRLEMRGFVDDKQTPTHDGREGWNGPFIPVGELVIPQKSDATRADADKANAAVEELGFSIGNRWDSDEKSMKGRGVLNEFREEVYAASHEGRGTSGAKAKGCPLGFG